MTPDPEFSRPVLVAKVMKSPSHWPLVASEAERDALARRFDLIAIGRLEGNATLERMEDGSIRLEATVVADVVQHCVVSLEPVPASLHEDFCLVFKPGIDDEEADRLALEDPEGDLVEPMPKEIIDLGEILAQQVSLALDPYPRAPGADAELPQAGAPDEPLEVKRGLAALANFKPREK